MTAAKEAGDARSGGSPPLLAVNRRRRPCSWASESDASFGTSAASSGESEGVVEAVMDRAPVVSESPFMDLRRTRGVTWVKAPVRRSVSFSEIVNGRLRGAASDTRLRFEIRGGSTETRRERPGGQRPGVGHDPAERQRCHRTTLNERAERGDDVPVCRLHHSKPARRRTRNVPMIICVCGHERMRHINEREHGWTVCRVCRCVRFTPRNVKPNGALITRYVAVIPEPDRLGERARLRDLRDHLQGRPSPCPQYRHPPQRDGARCCTTGRRRGVGSGVLVIPCHICSCSSDRPR
jgi:hypothetical protein